MSSPAPNVKKKLAFVLGCTPNMAFAAGTLALSLLQRMPGLDFDVIIIDEGLSSPPWHDPEQKVTPQARQDAELLASLPRSRLLPTPQNTSPRKQ